MLPSDIRDRDPLIKGEAGLNALFEAEIVNKNGAVDGAVCGPMRGDL